MFLKDLFRHRELLWILVGRTLKIRYKRSVLGFFWTFLNPVFLILIYAVFLKILKFYDPSNPLFMPMLVTGIIGWQFTSMCCGDGLHAVLGNSNLITKTSFPRIILPLSMVLANLVNFLLSLLILLVYVLAIGTHFSSLWLLPVALLTHLALCLGLALILSATNVFFRDTEHLLGMVLLAWFFLTPVIYPFSQIPVEFQRLAFLNPMTGIITAYRTVFLSTDVMAPRLLAMSFSISWLVCAAGMWLFQRVQGRFGDEL
jgi:ABC-type polysaccharide/polyol phosphate export permease